MKGNVSSCFILIALFISCSNHTESEAAFPVSDSVEIKALETLPRYLSLYLSPHKDHDWIERKIELKDSIGVLSIYLQPEFNFFQKWMGYNDYHCGNTQCYRFASSKFSLENSKSEWLYEIPHPFYGLTIKHRYYPECGDDFEFDPHQAILGAMELRKQRTNGLAIFDTIGTTFINGLDFAVWAVTDTSSDKIITRQFKAATYFNNTYITFEFSNNTNDYRKKEFIKESYRMLKTLKFQKY